jgi:predicted dehydrogenase
MGGRKRYCLVGTGVRSRMFTGAIWGKYADMAELVGLCDTDQGRMNAKNADRPSGTPELPTYLARDFDRMVAECKPNTVIVTSMDVTHSDYIIRAMELGCDVITEKPMTTDEVRCRRILDARKRTGRNLRVTFNYRYAPPRSQVKEIIQSGQIGEVVSVDFTWLLDTRHGADYFRRWHSHRRNSGSLLVHKATHHFDLVNWWIGQHPKRVSAFASRRFYTPQMADEMGLQGRGERCLDCPVGHKCKFRIDLTASPVNKSLYLDCEKYTGYVRDRCVFRGDIDIWDNMVVNVEYDAGALMSYCLMAHMPWEGYRVYFNGTKGRLEHIACESTYTSGDGSVPGELQPNKTFTRLIPNFEQVQEIPIRTGAGGHGGGDNLLLDDLFLPNPPADTLNRAAGAADGAYSILTGVAAYHSIDSGRIISVDELLGEWAGKMD